MSPNGGADELWDEELDGHSFREGAPASSRPTQDLVPGGGKATDPSSIRLFRPRVRDYLLSLTALPLVLSIDFCSHESVPGWETFHVGWQAWVYVTIVLVAGAFAGVVYGRSFPLTGALSGALAGVGAFYTITLFLHVLPMTTSKLVIVLGALGSLPGFGVFWLRQAFQKKFNEVTERRRSQATPVPESAWPKALRLESEKDR